MGYYDGYGENGYEPTDEEMEEYEGMENTGVMIEKENLKISKKEQVSIMLEENMQRKNLTVYEQAQGSQMMLDLGGTDEPITDKTGSRKTTIRCRLDVARFVQDDTRSITFMLEKAGVKRAYREIENELWTGKWRTVKEFDLYKDIPKQISLPKGETQRYYIVWYRKIRVVEMAPKKRGLAPWEYEQKRKDKVKRQIRAVLKKSSARRGELIQNIVSGKNWRGKRRGEGNESNLGPYGLYFENEDEKKVLCRTHILYVDDIENEEGRR